jgi:hypothetical protein
VDGRTLNLGIHGCGVFWLRILDGLDSGVGGEVGMS